MKIEILTLEVKREINKNTFKEIFNFHFVHVKKKTFQKIIF